jgi:hypothetical protein
MEQTNQAIEETRYRSPTQGALLAWRLWPVG